MARGSFPAGKAGGARRVGVIRVGAYSRRGRPVAGHVRGAGPNPLSVGRTPMITAAGRGVTAVGRGARSTGRSHSFHSGMPGGRIGRANRDRLNKRRATSAARHGMVGKIRNGSVQWAKRGVSG